MEIKKLNPDDWAKIWNVNAGVNHNYIDKLVTYKNTDEIWNNEADPSMVKRKMLHNEGIVPVSATQLVCTSTHNGRYYTMLLINSDEGSLLLRSDRNEIDYLDQYVNLEYIQLDHRDKEWSPASEYMTD